VKQYEVTHKDTIVNQKLDELKKIYAELQAAGTLTNEVI